MLSWNAKQGKVIKIDQMGISVIRKLSLKRWMSRDQEEVRGWALWISWEIILGEGKAYIQKSQLISWGRSRTQNQTHDRNRPERTTGSLLWQTCMLRALFSARGQRLGQWGRSRAWRGSSHQTQSCKDWGSSACHHCPGSSKEICQGTDWQPK